MEPKLRPDLPDGAVMDNGMKNQTTSADRFMGRSTIWGKDGEHETPYMTRYWFGRLRLHIFYRGDQDPDCHDHPWDFWTFPFVPYVEEVVHPDLAFMGREQTVVCRSGPMRANNVVPAWRPTFRPATHTHRVLGPAEFGQGGVVAGHHKGRPYAIGTRPIVTLVWRSRPKRKWGFLKSRDGKWCWIAWKEYVFRGGKSAPCE